MNSRKIYRLLAVLSESELEEFHEFLNGSLFTKSDRIRKLFDFIRPYYPEFNHPELTEKAIQKKLGKPMPLDNDFVTNRFAELSQLVKMYLSLQHLQRNESFRKEGLRQSMLARNLHGLYQNEIKNSIEELYLKEDNSWSHHLDLWALNYEYFTKPYTNKWNMKIDPSIEMINHLDEAYIILKLRYGFHQRSRGSIFMPSQSSILLETIIGQVKDHENPVVQLYLLLLKNFEAADLEKHWKKVYRFYKKNFASLPLEEKTAGMIGLINRGFKIAKNGQASFYRSILQLYKFALKKKILIQDGMISESSFKNIALLGATVEEIKWTTFFIKKYEPLLPPDYDKNILYLAKAYLSFYEDKIDECGEWLRKIDQPIMRDKMNFRSINLRCLYELYCKDKSQESVLLSELDSYKKFLNRKKNDLDEGTLKAYKNFVHLIKIMTRARQLPLEERKKKLAKIEVELSKRKDNIAETWFAKKIKTFLED